MSAVHYHAHYASATSVTAAGVKTMCGLRRPLGRIASVPREVTCDACALSVRRDAVDRGLDWREVARWSWADLGAPPPPSDKTDLEEAADAVLDAMPGHHAEAMWVLREVRDGASVASARERLATDFGRRSLAEFAARAARGAESPPMTAERAAEYWRNIEKDGWP